ncbi:oligosaccharide flippase family protein, partial [Bacillus cereus]|uniref:oligosaccharide flippase family protein n=1 Tax=Bacillus cereus TaxID=1396 RepID=UPI002112A434
IVLNMTAPLIAEAMLGKQSINNNVGEVTTSIRLVSFALIVVPAASLFRGYFHGHQSLGPTTVSQIFEQIIRIVFLLAG